MNNYTIDDFKSEVKITNTELDAYASSHVNLPHDLATKYREQVKSLRTRLEDFIVEHPDYDLVKMLHSGSLAKGSALRSINDLDTAIYVKAAAVGDSNNCNLIAWLHERAKEVYPNFLPEQLEEHEHCVTIHYKTPGLMKVDLVPVLYEGDKNNKGYLVTKDGKRVLTSISLHIEFIRQRKKMQQDSFIQAVRFAKYWSKQVKEEYKSRNDHFRFKSLIIELIFAYLSDNGLNTSNYTKALQAFFGYIVKSELREVISFNDYYSNKEIEIYKDACMHIYDPVNPKNNIARTYSELQRQQIVLEAKKALNAIITAEIATTKQEAIRNWQIIFGPTFRG